MISYEPTRVPAGSASRSLGSSCAGLFEKVAGGLVCIDERLHFLQQRAVAAARFAQPRASNVARLVERFLEHDLESFELLGVHDEVSSISGDAAPSNARFSHARAIAHCRLTVAGETPTASAVSSTVSPPK